MIKIRTLDVGSSAVGNSPDVSGKRFWIVFVKALIAFSQGLCYHPRKGFARFPSDRLGKPMSLRAFDV